MPAKSEMFSYASIRNASGEVLWRPMLPVTLSVRTRIIDVVGLVDTGADVNVLPYGVGLDLGLRWEDQRPVAGLSGNLASHETRAIILTGTIGDFRPFNLAFAWTRTDTVPVILGHMNFLLEFDVCFYRTRGTLKYIPEQAVEKPVSRYIYPHKALMNFSRSTA